MLLQVPLVLLGPGEQLVAGVKQGLVVSVGLLVLQVLLVHLGVKVV